MATQLSKNFTLEELIKAPKEYNNVPGAWIIGNLKRLTVECLQPLRDYIDKAITVHSGYRGPAYNKSVGGDKNSEHLYGYAADITIADVTNQEIIDAAKLLKLPWQLILDEQCWKLRDGELVLSKWIHISCDETPDRIVKTVRNTKEDLNYVYTVISKGL